jgi:hypothetical protein
VTSTMPVSHPTGLVVIALSEKEWRVSDPSRRSDDALCLLGFIQRVDTAFEVTVIGRPRERHYCGSFNSALQCLAAASEGSNR